jgi:hypothetical protein
MTGRAESPDRKITAVDIGLARQQFDHSCPAA